MQAVGSFGAVTDSFCAAAAAGAEQCHREVVAVAARRPKDDATESRYRDADRSE